MASKAEMAVALQKCMEKSDISLLQSLYRKCDGTDVLTATQKLLLVNGVLNMSELEEPALNFLVSYFFELYPDLFCDLNFEDTGVEVLPPDIANRERKLKFLQDYENVKDYNQMKNNLINLWAAAEPIFNRDIIELSKDEMVAGYANMGTVWTPTLRLIIFYAKKYVHWCRKNEIISSKRHPIEQIKATDIPITKAISRFLLKDPDALMDFIETSVSLDEGRIMVPALCLSWLGVPSSEMLKVNDHDVDILNGTIKFGNIEINDIPSRIKDALRIYKGTNEAMRWNRFVIAENTGYFLRRFVEETSANKNLPVTQKEISQAIVIGSNAYKSFGGTQQITLKNTLMSGRLYRLRQRLIKKSDLTRADFAEICMLDEKKTNFSATVNDWNRQLVAYCKFIWGENIVRPARVKD